METRIGTLQLKGHKNDWVVSDINVSDSKKNKGLEYEANSHFFGTLYQALFFIFNCRVAEADKVSIKELKKQVNKVGKEIKKLADDIEGKLTKQESVL